VVKLTPVRITTRNDRNMNRLSGTHLEVSATSYPKASFTHSSETIPPLKGTPDPTQQSRHVTAVRSISATNYDGSRSSRRWLNTLISILVQNSVTALQLEKQLGITMNNSPACQSQLLRLNSGGYKDQQIQIDQLRSASIHVHSTASVRYKSPPSPWSLP